MAVPLAAIMSSVGVTAASASTTSNNRTLLQNSSASAVTKSDPLLLWVDPPRIPAVKAFEKAYPNIPVSINTLNGSASNAGLEEKFDLFNKVGSGWPDAIFWPSNQAMSWAAGTQSSIDYAADLSSLVPKKIQGGYAPATIAECIVGGQLYCLRNDVAPTVLWYNATLFKKWGYTPPKTWPQYEALGLKIAKQHPGYYVGLAGDIYTPDRYLWSSGCPTNDQISTNKVMIDLNAPSCTRVVNLMNALLKAKVMSPDGIFETAAATSVGPKLVMTPGAAWYGVYLYEDTFKVPPGQMTATNALQWPGTIAGTGDEGGGLWSMSDHITGQRKADTLKFLEFMATAPAWQVDLSTGLPAYGPDQKPWIARQCKSGYFVDCTQMATALVSAAKIIRPDHENLLYSSGQIWTQTVVPALTAGKSLDSVWGTYDKSMINYAKSFGYAVVTSCVIRNNSLCVV
jgi:ABC-type glycerol-3-phosphate transport system substrate-binding protein